jgi:predicted permease
VTARGPRLLRRLAHLLHRRQFEDDLAEELAFHRALKQQDLEERGHSAEQAAFAAKRALGSAALAQDQARDAWTWPWLADGVRDVRYGARMLRRNPGFTVVAVMTLALGIGANTAIFSLLDAVLLRTLPVRDPQQLVFFGRTAASGSTGFTPNGRTELFSYSFFHDFRRANQVFSDVAAMSSVLYRPSGRIGNGDVERVAIELVSGSYFHTLGVSALVGRTFADTDDATPGGHAVAIASYSWARQRFDNVSSILGSTVSIGSHLYVVVGVAPPAFSGMTVGQSPDLWIPLAMQREISPGWNGLERPMFQTLHMVARLKPEVTTSQAQASTNLLFRNILRTYVGSQPGPNTLRNIGRAYVALTPAATGRAPLRSQFSSPLQILMGVVAVVLVIACANVANLLLARASARQREIAVRMSLGAGRLRLVRQLLVESLLLGVGGALAGVALASAASRWLVTLVSTGVQPLALIITPDSRVLAFTLGATLVTVLLFGAVPALHATRLDLAPSLKDGGTSTAARRRTSLSRVLVAGQVALSVVLIIGAILFLRSLLNLLDVDTGFDKRNVIVAAVDPGAAEFKPGDARVDGTMTRIEERIASIPAVRGASFALSVFDGGSWSSDAIDVPGRARLPNDASVDLNLVGPQYLDVMRMPILAGRGLSSRDTAASRPVAVINETMALMYFGEPRPVGRMFTVRDDERPESTDLNDVEVIGVVRNAKYTRLRERQMPAAFFPHAQHPRNFLSLVVRHDGEAAVVVPALRNAVADVDPNLHVNDVTTLERLVSDSVVNSRAIAQLSALFGVLAGVLACVGIYGVTSYGVARRTNEFGVRLALGAQKIDVFRLVLEETTRLGLVGIAIGLLLAAAAGRFISSLLFGLTPYDPAAIGVAASGMMAVALLAGYLPARRATRIDPLLALRRD